MCKHIKNITYKSHVKQMHHSGVGLDYNIDSKNVLLGSLYPSRKLHDLKLKA